MTEVGSTAIAGITGKQDLDFAVRGSAERFEEARSVLDGLYQRNDAQQSDTGFPGYILESSLDASVQLLAAGSQYDTF